MAQFCKWLGIARRNSIVNIGAPESMRRGEVLRVHAEVRYFTAEAAAAVVVILNGEGEIFIE